MATKKLKFVVSLTNDENDYQQEQAAAADRAARRLGVEVTLVHANNDAVTQSQQLLQFVQSAEGTRPDAIVFEPAGGTGFPQVAQAATAAKIGWVVLNHEADYLQQLRKSTRVPVFSISSDHVEVGRIQGQQLAALLPDGGSVLHIEGPPGSSAAKQRTEGMNQTKTPEIQVKTLRAQWTEETAYRAVSSWLRLQTSHEMHLDAVAAQDDSMAAGARKAFGEIVGGERDRWLQIPFLGCDGMPKTGQSWVRAGIITATVYIRPNADLALEMLTDTLRGGAQPQERTLTLPESFPALEEIARAAKGKAGKHRAASV
jgi:ribose transport system substrate-binding protein